MFLSGKNLISSINENYMSREPGGVLRISSDRDDRRIFLGFKFSISRFFGTGNIWQVFLGQLDLCRDILGYSKQSEDSR